MMKSQQADVILSNTNYTFNIKKCYVFAGQDILLVNALNRDFD